MANQLPANRRYNLSLQQRVRRGIAPEVEAGLARCARCGERIKPGELWDLGHVDGTNRTVISGPEHRRCNRATSRHALESGWSRRW